MNLKKADPLLDLGFSLDAIQVYGNVSHIVIGDMSRYPNAVLVGMRRELERLEFVKIPAFAHGKLLYTPQGLIQIALNGQASTANLDENYNFQHKAREASYRMSSESDFSYNTTFANEYLSPQFCE